VNEKESSLDETGFNLLKKGTDSMKRPELTALA